MIAVDLFAGAGGSSTGLASAGITVAAAVNHWPRAVETHSRAHPGTVHHCEDAAILDPTTLPAHDLLWAAAEASLRREVEGRIASDRRQRDLLDAEIARLTAALEVAP